MLLLCRLVKLSIVPGGHSPHGFVSRTSSDSLTSKVIAKEIYRRLDLDDPVVVAALPDEVAVYAITLGSLPPDHSWSSTKDEAARRQVRLQQVEAMFEPLPFDTVAARSYEQLLASVVQSGRLHRSRVADLLIAATAHSNGLSLYTRNSNDFLGLDKIVAVVGV